MSKCPNCGHVDPPRHARPKGIKHVNCLAHIPHPYPSNGFLCVSEPIPELDSGPIDDRIAWANEIAAVAEAHRAAERERMGLPTEAWRRSWSVLTHEMVKLANGRAA